MMNFNYDELIAKINGIDIVKEGHSVVTYYNGIEKARKDVSGRYEIFDFKPFVIGAIDAVMKVYEIDKYTLSIVGGRQEIRLFSHKEEIKGESFTKVFYLLNSSDKSRALSFSYGLMHNNFHYISTNGTIYKKHYTGITKYVEDRIDLDDTIFEEQLDLMRLIIGDSILMSNVQKLITGSEVLQNAKVSLKNNFESFKSRLYNATRNGQLSESNRSKLSVSWMNRQIPVDFTQVSNDFMVDSFLVFKTYLGMFKMKDASFIIRESKRINEMSVMTNRNSVIDDLLSEV